ncbi:hypothetical protein BO94DRAFT_51572 [Aspergillus sclerotioniger CBS 115572]|uniref:Uncharacterized protein n=1 Tax=Aspergillus sclerotioniger CBS 115572 TaxID=1450535 RepID=A0A317WU23_9EURO|nr:hypothetical protein BO94DRAFT_51572 [Aspergillus sclerotioniger CBS 115572]PWY88782.1 hypothetical protein BO94DRAFT_51572 [Aspergillus sclerotioniger CBS 115572]
MSSSSKKVTFRDPLEDAPFESAGAEYRDDGRHNTKGATRSGQPRSRDVTHIQTSYSSPPHDHNLSESEEPVEPRTIYEGEYRTPFSQRVTRLPHGPTLRIASAAEEIIMGTSSLQALNELPLHGERGATSPAEHDSRGNHTTLDETIHLTPTPNARKAFSLRGIIQKARAARKKSRIEATTITEKDRVPGTARPIKKSKSKGNIGGVEKTAIKSMAKATINFSKPNTRSQMTSLGAISNPTPLPTPSLLQQLERKHIEIGPSQDLPAPARGRQAVSTLVKAASSDSLRCHVGTTSFKSPHRASAVTGHRDTHTAPISAPSRPTGLRKPEGHPTRDASVQTEPPARGSVWTCDAQFDILGEAVCRKVRQAETAAQRDRYLQMALEVQKLLSDYKRSGEAVEETSKSLDEKIAQKESIEAELRARSSQLRSMMEL